jgi:two-component system, OmpR family, phosphate regulon sensor histidine kinase PhoR
MRPRTFTRRFFPLYLATIFVVLAVSGWIATGVTQHLYMATLREDLEIRVRLLGDHIYSTGAKATPVELDSICKHLGSVGQTRVTLIAPDGVVLGDSHDPPETMENHADRPEIVQALAGQVGFATRFSPTLRQKMIYVAIPQRDAERIIWVARASMPLSLPRHAMNRIYLAVGLSGALIALIAGLTGYYIFRHIRRSLAMVSQEARRFSQGDLSHKLSVPNSQELNELAQTLNLMAEQLEERISIVTRQRGELEAILSSMVEGVIVFDLEERVLSLNQAAARLLGVAQIEVRGRSIQEVIFNRDFQQFVARILSQRTVQEEGLTLHRGALLVQVQGTPLRDATGREIGALIVVNDISRLRRLENLRREFVGNVSHELRTPITAIKGFVETLREGVSHDPKESARFLDIIARHTDRLNAIIEDLLALSRLEQEAESGAIPMQTANLREVILAALQVCEHKAADKNITCEFVAGEEVNIKANAPLLEQAIVNLLDNAINYSEPGGEVQTGVEKVEGEWTLFVRDTGCGIEAQHLPRLFERFYRVDKTRSRQQGGTGLGLAIVKHIALAHKGHVSVISTPSQGSTFRVHLPL